MPLPGVIFINEDKDFSEPTTTQRKTEKSVMCMEEETTEDTVLMIAGSLKSAHVTCLCRRYQVSNTCLASARKLVKSQLPNFTMEIVSRQTEPAWRCDGTPTTVP